MNNIALLRSLVIAVPALLASCAPPAYQARGQASYVADQYTGRPTSSGEPYYPQGWTAAHTTLPFGTVVKVKNNYNGRTVNVTINDRFPYYPNRIINLSRAAAEHLQIPYHQLGDVTVTAKTIPGAQQQGGYSQQAPAPAANYGTPPPANYSAPSKYGAPPPGYDTPPNYSAPPSYSTPPPGQGLPSGLPPAPPGYR